MTCGRDVRDVSRGPSDENGGIAKGMVPGAAETRIEERLLILPRLQIPTAPNEVKTGVDLGSCALGHLKPLGTFPDVCVKKNIRFPSPKNLGD